MKRKVINIALVVFLLIINTNYFWESKLGLFAIPVFIFLVIIYFIFVALIFWELFSLVIDKRERISRLRTIGLISAVLVLIFLYPNGVWNFNDSQEENIFKASREGAANCRTTLWLNKDNEFRERNVCFSVSEITGTYEYKNDTIFFSNVELGRGVEEYYEFAIIRQSKYDLDKNMFDLVRYRSHKDTVGHLLWINKNELPISK